MKYLGYKGLFTVFAGILFSSAAFAECSTSVLDGYRSNEVHLATNAPTRGCLLACFPRPPATPTKARDLERLESEAARLADRHFRQTADLSGSVSEVNHEWLAKFEGWERTCALYRVFARLEGPIDATPRPPNIRRSSNETIPVPDMPGRGSDRQTAPPGLEARLTGQTQQDPIVRAGTYVEEAGNNLVHKAIADRLRQIIGKEGLAKRAEDALVVVTDLKYNVWKSGQIGQFQATAEASFVDWTGATTGPAFSVDTSRFYKNENRIIASKIKSLLNPSAKIGNAPGSTDKFRRSLDEALSVAAKRAER